MKLIAKQKRIFGKYGLAGNSGLMSKSNEKEEIQIIHISSNYDSNGNVFVEVKDKEWGTVWQRMSRKEAKRRKLSVIKCRLCSGAAVSLDHHYPYSNEMNRCKKHYW